MSSYKHFKLTDITSNRYIPKLISDYLNNKENLNNLYSHTLQIESFKDIIKNINFNFDKRSVLVKVLKEQSKDSNTSKQTFDNIDSLAQGNTYCVTTGHQPSIFLGPAYFLYKIIHTIKLCAELANKFTDTNFVPIFWMATEDHDFEEISSINLFKKKISWDPGEIKEAAVGRLKLTNIDTCKESIANTLYRELANNPITKEVLDCYTNDKTLAQATREALNILFGKHGLVILDGDNKDLKRLFAPVIKDDIFNNKAFNIVKNISSEINNCGYKAQIYPQHINVFYLNKEYRKYIIEHKNGYSVTDLNIHLSKSEITNLIDTQPELFSPNVVLRPLYQETILPNLAYIGGGNEIAYWLQLKDMFSAYKTTFPMLIVRNSVSIINDAAYKHLEELNLNILDFINGSNEIASLFTKRYFAKELSLEHETEAINKLFDSLIVKYVLNKSDINIEKNINAQRTKALKLINKISDKLIKHSKHTISNNLNQIERLKQAILPGNTLQERYMSSLFILSTYNNIITELYNDFSPITPNHYLIKRNT